jgi:hypothetical protein
MPDLTEAMMSALERVPDEWTPIEHFTAMWPNLDRLKPLDAAGLIEGRLAFGPGGGNQFRRTPAGRKALERCL